MFYEKFKMLKTNEKKDDKVSSNERQFVGDALLEGLRVDGRGLLDFRDIEVTFSSDYGRLELSLGDTKVMVVISCSVVAPYEDKPTEGFYKFNVELSPMASPMYSGRISISSIEIARIIERGLRQSKSIDTESLCIIAGSKVWSIRIDVHVIDDFGNLIDACVAGAVAALHHFRRPDVTIEDGEVKVHSFKEKEPIPLSLHHLPISVTFGLFEGDIFVVDPLWKEEKVAKGRFSVMLNSNLEICSIQKAGGMALDVSNIMRILKVAKTKAKELSQIVREAIQEDDRSRAL